MAKSVTRSTRLRRRRRRNGQCWWCPKRALAGKTFCRRHLEANRQAYARYAEKRRLGEEKR